MPGRRATNRSVNCRAIIPWWFSPDRGAPCRPECLNVSWCQRDRSQAGALGRCCPVAINVRQHLGDVVLHCPSRMPRPRITPLGAKAPILVRADRALEVRSQPPRATRSWKRRSWRTRGARPFRHPPWPTRRWQGPGARLPAIRPSARSERITALSCDRRRVWELAQWQRQCQRRFIAFERPASRTSLISQNDVTRSPDCDHV